MTVKARVRGFQSIRDAEIEINGLTVVTGVNNSGKTALARAVTGVFQNTPGDSFVRRGESQCTVEVDFGDAKVSWSKGKNIKPTYIVNDGDPIYPGRAVPDEVASMGVKPVSAGGQDVWPTVAPQFTGQVFLLNQPGAVVAEAVADVERVGLLNRALRAVDSDRRKASNRLKVRQSDLVDAEQEVAFFDGLDSAASLAYEARDLAQGVRKIAKGLEKVRGVRERYESAKTSVAALAGVEGIVVPEDTASPLLDELGHLRDAHDALQAARSEVERLGALDVDELPSNWLEDDVCNAQEIDKQRVALVDLSLRIEQLRSSFEEGQGITSQKEVDLAKAEGEASELLASLGTCPFCGAET